MTSPQSCLAVLRKFNMRETRRNRQRTLTLSASTESHVADSRSALTVFSQSTFAACSGGPIGKPTGTSPLGRLPPVARRPSSVAARL